MSTTTPKIDLANLISLTIGKHLSNWLKVNKNVDVSEAEIADALGLPYVKPENSLTNQNIASQMPSVTGFKEVTRKPSSKRKERRKKVFDENAPKCEYLIQRGKKKGDRCSSPCENDPNILGSDRYCKVCLKKKTVQRSLTGNNDKKRKVQPPMIKNNQHHNKHHLDVSIYDENEGLYINQDTGFIVKQDEELNTYAIGKKVNGECVPLDANDKAIAQKLGIFVFEKVESSNVDSQNQLPESPKIPQLPNSSNVPLVPDLPQVPQVPQLPQAPQIPNSQHNIPVVPEIYQK